MEVVVVVVGIVVTILGVCVYSKNGGFDVVKGAISNSGGSVLKLVNLGIDGDLNRLKLNGVVVSCSGGGVTNKWS